MLGSCYDWQVCVFWSAKTQSLCVCACRQRGWCLWKTVGSNFSPTVTGCSSCCVLEQLQTASAKHLEERRAAESPLIITHAHTFMHAHCYLDHQAPTATHTRHNPLLVCFHWQLLLAKMNEFESPSVCVSVSSLQSVCLPLTVSYKLSPCQWQCISIPTDLFFHMLFQTLKFLSGYFKASYPYSLVLICL